MRGYGVLHTADLTLLCLPDLRVSFHAPNHTTCSATFRSHTYRRDPAVLEADTSGSEQFHAYLKKARAMVRAFTNSGWLLCLRLHMWFAGTGHVSDTLLFPPPAARAQLQHPAHSHHFAAVR